LLSADHETNVGPGECATNNSVTAISTWPGPAPGENAYGDDCGGEGGFATFQRYSGPSGGAGGMAPFWYSFDIGSVHFALFSSEHDYRAGSAQRAWLERDLRGVDRALTPWLIVGMHRPGYNARDDSDWTISTGLLANLEELFVEARVDLLLSGHYHLYERTHSVKNFTVDESGASPVYVTVGTGGATYHNEPMRNDSSWSAADLSEWGFGLVEAFNRSTLRFSFRANEECGVVRDEVFIRRPERDL
jgi:acid phosphatase type 7